MGVALGSQNLGSTGALHPWDGVWLTLRNMPLSHVTMLNLVALVQAI